MSGMLQVLGLSATEQSLYELLLTQPPLTTEEVHTLTTGRIWETGTDGALRRLTELGLVTLLPEDPPRHVVVPTDAALEALIAAGERSLAIARQRINQLSARYRQGWTGGDPLELVEVIRGREAVAEGVVRVLRSARHEVRCFIAPPFLGVQHEPDPIQLEQLAKGIRYRVIYDPRCVDVPGLPAQISSAGEAGSEARVADVPTKMVMSDYPMAIGALSNDPVGVDAALVVHDSTLLEALSALFESLWERAVPLHVKEDQQKFVDHDAPNEIDRALLPLLTAGMTDQAIADHLGWHERTAHRHLREMMRRLDAATRFQAGYQAVRRGWLTDADKCGEPDAAR
jgi:DNA-binding NarL/FixJ family response regulator/sugar-specific transcriptional regulator TrmB